MLAKVSQLMLISGALERGLPLPRWATWSFLGVQGGPQLPVATGRSHACASLPLSRRRSALQVTGCGVAAP